MITPEKFPENDDVIEATAATWLIESEDGLTPAQADEFARWKRADHRHAAACERLSRSNGIISKWPLLADAPQAGEQTATVAGSKGRWGYPALLAAAGMAAVLALALGGWWVQTHATSDAGRYVTGNGGYQRALLPDGSTIELNANSELRVLFSESERRIALLRGEAFFAVAKKTGLPFVVATGPIRVTAVGTAFNVKAHDTRISVMVTEGTVKLGRETSSDRATEDVSMVTGETASISAESSASRPEIAKVGFEAMRDTLHWRQPKLVFNNTPLSEVVAQFNLRNQLQISIEDDELAARPVAGTYHADNVAAFVRLLEEQGEVSVERRDHARFILRKPGSPPALNSKQD